MSKKAKKASAPRGRQYETTRSLKKDELSGQELVVFSTIKKLGRATSAQVLASSRAQLKSKAKNVLSSVAWYVNHLNKSLKLVRPVKKAA